MSDQPQGTVSAATTDRSTFRLFKYGGIAVAFGALHILPIVGPPLVAVNLWIAERIYIPVNILIGVMLALIAVRVMFMDRVNTGQTGWDARPGCIAGVIILLSIGVMVVPLLGRWNVMNTWVSVIIAGIFLSIGLANWFANRK